MRTAINLARKGMNSNTGGPFGCVIVKDGKVIARAHNSVKHLNDPTAHAEVVAIRKIPFERYELPDGIKVFEDWKVKPDKIHY